jgi:hypothetical protein
LFKFDYVALELVGSQSLVFLWHLLFLEVVALYVVLAHLVDVHILYVLHEGRLFSDLLLSSFVLNHYAVASADVDFFTFHVSVKFAEVFNVAALHFPTAYITT